MSSAVKTSGAVLPVLEELSRDQAVVTEDALDDIRMFVPNAVR